MPEPASTPSNRWRLGADSWPYLLSPLIIAAVVADLAGAPATVIFFVSAVALIPPAAMMGRATEELAERSGNVVGGLLNVTFGNAPELIIALFALGKGLHEVVKASLVGSILGNILLVLGAAMFVGGLGRDSQVFNRTAASAQSSMLLLAGAAITMPAVFTLVSHGALPGPHDEIRDFPSKVEHLSLWISVLMIAVYFAGLIFSMKTHRDLFNPEHDEEEGHELWSVRRSVTMLAIAGVAVGVMSEILVGSIHHAAESVGLSEFFIGAIVIAIVGNAAEHWVAVLVARK